MSSVLVAEGDPARLLGLIDPTSVLWEAVQASGAFVVHVRTAADRALAERFSEVRPPIRAPFERLQVAESPWGPVLGGRRPRVACRLTGAAPVGYGQLVEGVIEQLELDDGEDPLAWLHGRYRSVGDLPGQAEPGGGDRLIPSDVTVEGQGRHSTPPAPDQQVAEHLGHTLDNDGLDGIVRGHDAPGIGAQVANLAGLDAAAEPDRLVLPDPQTGITWGQPWPCSPRPPRR